MSKEFYSYFKDEIENDAIVYSFKTVSEATYSVYFRPYVYSEYLEDYPHLLQNGYAFGFFQTSPPSKRYTKDKILYTTIRRIIRKFLEEHGENIVLLYHCDYLDGKQKGREKMFSDWYENSTHKHLLIKHTIELILPNTEDKETIYYMGYLVSAENPMKDIVQDEFETFAQHITTDKAA